MIPNNIRDKFTLDINSIGISLPLPLPAPAIDKLTVAASGQVLTQTIDRSLCSLCAFNIGVVVYKLGVAIWRKRGILYNLGGSVSQLLPVTIDTLGRGQLYEVRKAGRISVRRRGYQS